MDKPPVCIDAAFLGRLPGIELVPHTIRLLATGRPVALEEIARAASVSVGRAEELLTSQPGCEWDDAGRLVGFGLTSNPTPHRLVLPKASLYTWCAMDTLLFTIIIGEETIATSHCPATGQPVRVEMSPSGIRSVQPAAAVVSQVVADKICDLRGEVCEHGHFFSSAPAAANWALDHPAGGVLSVPDAFEQSRSACEAIGWLAKSGES
jgi:alkylmercury lyase